MDNKFPLHAIDERNAQANLGFFSFGDRESYTKSQNLEKSLYIIVILKHLKDIYNLFLIIFYSLTLQNGQIFCIKIH